MQACPVPKQIVLSPNHCSTNKTIRIILVVVVGGALVRFFPFLLVRHRGGGGGGRLPLLHHHHHHYIAAKITIITITYDHPLCHPQKFVHGQVFIFFFLRTKQFPHHVMPQYVFGIQIEIVFFF